MRLLDLLLTPDPVRRVRLLQSLLAMSTMCAGIAAMHYFVWIGAAPRTGVAIWTAVAFAGMVAIYGAMRSGWSERLADPTLSVVQMDFAIACSAAAYALLGPGRGGVFPVVMVVLMYGMFRSTMRQMAGVCVFGVVVLGMTMAVMAGLAPARYPPAIELGHFLMVATMMPAASILAARLARLRERSSLQRAELSAALERIRQLATRDELTGLINRRHMAELMEQEHQRCIRSGHTFCVALLEVDDFGAHAGALGADGDIRLLRGVAQEAAHRVRVADVLAYWDDARFLLLMSDTRAALARAGLDRLREAVAGVPVLREAEALRITLSAGLAEHHAGETVEQTVARAEQALHDALRQGESRVVVA
ncbi:GGDEF domain-containing protein [Rubrivivax gelatinosus]|nr:GGDEF domain-containing protein [Rubrivivax gelatinosus]